MEFRSFQVMKLACLAGESKQSTEGVAGFLT